MLAALLTCLVLAVPDGDSLRVRCDGQAKPIAVRLLGADAPELSHPAFHIKEQPYGRQAQQHLQAMCYGKTVQVLAKRLDLYGRTLGSVACDGVDASTSQVQTGNAWAYMVTKKSPMHAYQAAAQAQHLGLWADANPIQPAQWRKMR